MLLLARPAGPAAGYLLPRPHSTVELVDRAQAGGLVERRGDSDDGRLTRVQLTADGEKRLNQLAAAHLEELQRLAPVLDQLAAASGTASADSAIPPAPGITS